MSRGCLEVSIDLQLLVDLMLVSVNARRKAEMPEFRAWVLCQKLADEGVRER